MSAGFIPVTFSNWKETGGRYSCPRPPFPNDRTGRKKWYDQVEFSGFADVYYMYNLNPKQGNDIDSTRAFETSNKNFAVNAVALTIQKAAEKVLLGVFESTFKTARITHFKRRLILKATVSIIIIC
ncbi:outer membrane domain protein [Leptospira interrogans serovar Copenhageni str. LT2050]|uniref:Outer membrane domain protein n=1 Tax=Leptospira interrogans serovar Copenhageni str. LT2050 TaxID=1001598 RepID=M3G384_LEPIT|nr:outer membrane domain protein [Leptospira interrogans serovar Copenhageni str. LT2050]